jgi:serine/threonine-protein kinase
MVAAAPDGYGSSTSTRMTGTMSLPVDRRLPILATLAGLAVLAIVVGVIVAGRLRPDAPVAAASSSAPPPSATAPAAEPDVPAASASIAAATASVAPPPPASVASVASVAPVAPPRPIVRPTTTATAAPVRTAPTPAAKPKTSCDPPWVIDERGHRQYKRECL